MKIYLFFSPFFLLPCRQAICLLRLGKGLRKVRVALYVQKGGLVGGRSLPILQHLLKNAENTI